MPNDTKMQIDAWSESAPKDPSVSARMSAGEASSEGFFSLDRFWRIRSANFPSQILAGLRPADLLGKTFDELFTTTDALKFMRRYRSLLKNGEFECFEETYEGRLFQIHCYRTEDQGITIFFRDISEARRAESELIERERTLDQIFQESPAFMSLALGPDLVYARANRKFYELTRLDSSVLGRSIREVFPELEGQGFLELLNRVYSSGEIYVGREVPLSLARPGGSMRQLYVDFVYQPLKDASGSVYGILTQGFDVTEKVLSRQAVEKAKASVENERENFRNLFRQTPEMVCILEGPEHRFEFVNEAHVKALGFDATGMTVRQAQPESVEVHGILDAVYRTGKTAELHEIPVTLTGRLRYFNLTYAARRNFAGEINGVMILGVEVTDQVLGRERLKQSLEKVREAILVRDEFLSIASHELKTPVTSLLLQMQIARRQLDGKDKRPLDQERFEKLVRLSQEQLNRLTRLIEDMLDISRIRTGRIQLQFEEVNASEVVREICEQFMPEFTEQDVFLTMDLESRVMIWADGHRVGQVVGNLLSNALKYGNRKPVDVRLSLGAAKARIEVRDHGMGIAPDKTELIFERFERAVSSNNISGLGLGLYISRQIVSSLKGKIWVESDLGRGSKFVVELPLAFKETERDCHENG